MTVIKVKVGISNKSQFGMKKVINSNILIYQTNYYNFKMKFQWRGL